MKSSEEIAAQIEDDKKAEKQWSKSSTLFEHPFNPIFLDMHDPKKTKTQATLNFADGSTIDKSGFSSGESESFFDHYDSARQQRLSGNHQEALQSIERALSLVKTNTWRAYSLLEKGRIFRDLGNIQEARLYFEESKNFFPNPNPQVDLSLGILEEREGEFKKAETFYREAIRLNPEYPEALNNLGWVMVVLEKYEEAISYFDQALRLRPESHLYYNNRGIAKQRLNLFPQADKDFEQAITSQETARKSYLINYCHNKIFLNQSEEAIRILEDKNREAPHDLDIAIALSAAYMSNNKYAETIGLLQPLLLAHRDNILCLSNLATAYLCLKRYDEALDILDKLILPVKNSDLHQRKKCLLDIYKKIGIIMTAYGFWDEAVEAYNIALELTESSYEKDNIHFNRGNAFFDNKNFEQAIQDYQNISPGYKTEMVASFLQEAIAAASQSNEEEIFSSHTEQSTSLFDNKEIIEMLAQHCRVKLGDVASYPNNLEHKQDISLFSPVRTDVDNRYHSTCYELYKNPNDNDRWYRKKIARICKNTGKWIDISEGTERLATSSSVYAFIITEDNKILLNNLGHYNLAKHRPVKFAGCISFKDGIIGMWNNCSGHYKPHHFLAENIANQTQLPFDKFQPRHIMQKRIAELMKKYNRNFGDIANILERMTFGDSKLARDIYDCT